MPAKAPPVGEPLAAHLRSLGARLRAHRERQKVSATAAAEAAGLSRVTLHRIERGEASVTMGAWLSALDAVGLRLDVVDPSAPVSATPAYRLPERVRLDEHPQLRRLAWQLPGTADLSPAEALSLYERNWRHIDRSTLEPAEQALIQALVQQLGGGQLLV